MTKHCVVLCFILFALAVQELNGSSLETLSNTWASQFGEVPINKDSYGFYVDVDFSYNPSKAENMARMLLSLSNSETLLPFSCSDFDPYICSKFNCSVYSYYNSTKDYPTFSTSAHQIKTDVYLDYSSWRLRGYAYVANTCTGGSTTFGTARGGVIGLGTNDGSWQNYLNSRVFSIYFDKQLTYGKLLFRYDSSLGATKSPVTLNLDNNYRATFVNGYIQVGNYKSIFSGNLIFDIHAKAIGFPQSIFNIIMSYFKSTPGISSCSSDLTNPTCSYFGYLKDLPTLKLSAGSAIIELPPSVYVKNPTSGVHNGITLNLQAVSPALTGSNYVTPTFRDAVILDAQFMSYYYLVFDGSRVKFYVLGSSDPSPSPSIAGPIIGGVVAFLLISSICFCIFKKKKKIPAPASEEPTMIIQPSYNPAPMQPNNGYVYPQNTYPIPQQYAQQPGGYVQQPGYYPPQQHQQQGYVNYGA